MRRLVTVCILALVLLSSLSFAETPFTIKEQAWLDANEGRTFILGFTPYSGMDYFELNGATYGFLIDAVELFNSETGLNIVVDDTLTWGESYSGLFDGEIDVLFGANPTEERLKTMAFTDAIHKYNYTVLTRKNTGVTTLGDLDNKAVGFIEGDIVKEKFENRYTNINVTPVFYDDQILGMEALTSGDIQAFVTSGGEIIWEYLYLFPEVEEMVVLDSLTSDMTFSTLNNDLHLTSILDKIIANRREVIESQVAHARALFVRKILRLTYEEQAWLGSKPVIRVGVPNDYLPIDHYDYIKKDYTGVAGEYFKQYSDLLGIEIVVKSGSFDDMYEALEAGEIDLLNMAKTEERLKNYIYTNAFSNERDEIYGLRTSEYVQDIYGLEGKVVAVIEGFWHEELLKKNLQDVEIVITRDISETLQMIHDSEVDYFIENPTVSEYYIDQLGYTEIVKRGETSSDSYLYFGTQKDNHLIVQTFNKAMVLMDYDSAKHEGIQRAPTLENVFNARLTRMIFILIFVLVIAIYLIIRMIQSAIKQRADMAVMKEREHLMYKDVLTGLHNRLYFNEYSKKMNRLPYPQSMIVMDLNNLKLTNDTYGHQAGDQYINSFAKVLLELIPLEQIMRMGGDEFLICLSATNLKATEMIIKQIKDMTKDTKITLEDGRVINGPNPSIGYAIRNDSSISVDQLFHGADQMMYKDKAESKVNNGEVH